MRSPLRATLPAARLAIAAMAAALLVACGSPTTESTPQSSAAAFTPVTIHHKLGTTTLTARPTRIVALGSAATDAVLALAPQALVAGAASPVSPTGVSPWQEDKIVGNPQWIRMNSQGAFDTEAILAARPDLVLAQEAANAEALFTDLGGRIPVIAYHFAPLGDSWQVIAHDVGAALGDTSRAEGLIADVAKVTSAAPAGLRGKTWTFFAVPAPGSINVINTPDDPMAQFFAGYGMTIPTAVTSLPEFAGNPGTASVAPENYGVLAADLVIAAGADGTAESVIESPAFRTATRSAVVWPTDMTTAMALRLPTPLATPWVAEQVKVKLQEVAGR